MATRAPVVTPLGPSVGAPTADKAARRAEPATFLLLAVVRRGPGEAIPAAMRRVLRPPLGVGATVTYVRARP